MPRGVADDDVWRKIAQMEMSLSALAGDPGLGLKMLGQCDVGLRSYWERHCELGLLSY